MFRKSVLIPALLIAAACSGKNKADVAEKAAQLGHNAAQCPKLAEGCFRFTKGLSSKVINVTNDRNQQMLILDFNGVEKVPANGQDTAQSNGSRLTGSCITDTIRVVGKNKDGSLISMVVKPAQNGGLQVESSSPQVPAMNYAPAGPLCKIESGAKDMLPGKQTSTGLPQPGDQTNQ